MKTGNLEKDEGNTLEMMITLKKRNQKIVIKSLENIEFKISKKMFKKCALYFATLFTILVTTVIFFLIKLSKHTFVRDFLFLLNQSSSPYQSSKVLNYLNLSALVIFYCLND